MSALIWGVWLLSQSWEFKDKIAMLHLAQVQKNQVSGGVELRSLARQQSEDIWKLTTSEQIFPLESDRALSEGLLVLVELAEDLQILNIYEATDWVLNIVQQYLSIGVTPAALQQEIERAEQWRQDLTLQSQELARKTLEKEAHREQLKDLEDRLSRQKQELEIAAEELKIKEEEINCEKERLEKIAAQLQEREKLK